MQGFSYDFNLKNQLDILFPYPHYICIHINMNMYLYTYHSHLSPDEQQRAVQKRAAFMLGLGTFLVILISDPMVKIICIVGYFMCIYVSEDVDVYTYIAISKYTYLYARIWNFSDYYDLSPYGRTMHMYFLFTCILYSLICMYCVYMFCVYMYCVYMYCVYISLLFYSSST
jgi:hypothetical protein